ncbi:MAG TPA: glutathione S-transferase N-terminal domain-containing protein [Candidatus Polarisedimenticolia bacterium]|nr:glutathione S-transferase N-terminal domain-containing protein [Candidatus Polarisedimenticolia bacterium]
MIELFQYETCPSCRRVREKLSELMLDYVARQVPQDASQRTRLELATGQREIPALIDPEQSMVVTEAEDIVAYLQETYGQRLAAR